MKFFIDTANLEEIRQAQSLSVVDGLTTNPSLMAKEKKFKEKEIYQHYKDICDVLSKGDISTEVMSIDYENMLKEAEKLAEINPSRIVIKVPMTQDGIKLIKELSKRHIRTNCTLIFSASQALIAAKAGASYISPFMGRVNDISFDGIGLIDEICSIYNHYLFDTEILCASIRNPRDIVECAKLGVDVITAPFKVIESLFYHPLTNIGLDKFLSDQKNI